jgi:integrase
LIRKQKRQKSTQATKSHQIRSFFKFCRIQEYKTIEHYKILPVKTVMKEAKFLREEDIEKILNYSKSNLKTFVILKLFLTTGMRISEVVSLTSEQILNATRI